MTEQTTQITKTPPIIALARSMQGQIEMALPKHVSGDRMMRMIVTCLRNTPKLANCDQRSVLSAIIELSQLGLEPGTPLGHAWILPYGTTAQIIIGYKGYIALADRSGLVLMAEAVWEGDKFDYNLGTDPFVSHKPCTDPEKCGALEHAYAICQFPDGRKTFKVIGLPEISRAKQASQAWKAGQRNTNKRDSPWYTDEPAMWRKTAVRRIVPFLPLSAEYAYRMGRALELDQSADDGKPQAFDNGIDWGDNLDAAGEAVKAAEKTAANAKALAAEVNGKNGEPPTDLDSLPVQEVHRDT